MTISEAVQDIEVGAGILKLEDVGGGGDETEYKATEEGGVLAYTRNVEFIQIAEAIGAVGHYLVGEECRFSLNSLETNAAKIKELMGHGTVTTTAAGAGEVGQDELEFGGDFTLTEKQLTYTVKRRSNNNLNIIIVLFKVVPVTNIESQWQKAGPAGYAAQWRAVNDMSRDAGKRLGTMTVETAEAE